VKSTVGECTLKEYRNLVEEAKMHDRLYFQEANPIISDYAYDQLIKHIEAVEKLHPEWVAADSPTCGVHTDVKNGFEVVVHKHRMYSLANTYSQEELMDFVKRMEKFLDGAKTEYNVELKMDGVAVAIRYEKGKLVQAVTRGDGKQGDDVTDNVKTIANLPHELKGSDIPSVLDLRGEIYLPLQVFRELNQAKEEAGLEVYANPRNAAAGSLKLLDSKEARERRLSVVIYDMVEGIREIALQSEIAPFLKKLELPVFGPEHTAVCKSVDDVAFFAGKIEKVRDELPFEIDGIVIKLNTLRDRERIGYTGKCPRWAVAYKFAPEQAQTVIEDITVQVGRTGILTPVAELKPVKLAGSTISRATLHNSDEIKRKDIRIGDHVIIEKGGDVIPKVVFVDLHKRLPEAKKWHMPKDCPSCGKAVVHIEGEVAYRCTNLDCVSRNLRRITFFAAKGAMDIENLGEKVVEKLVSAALVATLADIYRLTYEDLSKIEGFKEKSIKNLLDAIEASKKTTLARFIFALGVKHVGQNTAEILAEYGGDIQSVSLLSFDELIEIDGIGPKVAAALVEFFQKKSNVEEIHALLDLGIQPQAPKKKKSTHLFSGKTFVLTGTLVEFSRGEAEELIKERGGKVSSSVSSKTDYLLVGEDAGSKLEKATKLNIAIMGETEFKKSL
jgi:DNA ligase (NAD+)